jgi:hypothetical protein
VLRKISDQDEGGLSSLGNHCETFEAKDDRTGERTPHTPKGAKRRREDLTGDLSESLCAP